MKAFDYNLTIRDEFSPAVDAPGFIQSVIDDSKVEDIFYDKDLVIPDVEGRILVIHGGDIKSRKRATLLIVERLYQHQMNDPDLAKVYNKEAGTREENLTLWILVPESKILK
jgi:hypothetical protein